MSTIITQPGRHAHPGQHPDAAARQHPDAAARQRRDRLAAASAADMEAALTFLGMIDPQAFEIAFTAVAIRADETPEIPETPETPEDAEILETPGSASAPADEVSEDASVPEDDEPFPVCRGCGASVGIFLAHGLRWQHFRGDAATSGTQEIYDPGHPAQATWLSDARSPIGLVSVRCGRAKIDVLGQGAFHRPPDRILSRASPACGLVAGPANRELSRAGPPGGLIEGDGCGELGVHVEDRVQAAGAGLGRRGAEEQSSDSPAPGAR